MPLILVLEWDDAFSRSFIFSPIFISFISLCILSAEETLTSSEAEEMTAESLEYQDPYADMPEPELALFVKGIHEVIDSIEVSIDQGHENAENLLEAKVFLEDVLADIRAARSENP